MKECGGARDCVLVLCVTLQDSSKRPNAAQILAYTPVQQRIVQQQRELALAKHFSESVPPLLEVLIATAPRPSSHHQILSCAVCVLRPSRSLHNVAHAAERRHCGPKQRQRCVSWKRIELLSSKPWSEQRLN